MQLNDKVALVLGSVKGIGKAIGLDLARAGARVVYTYHDWLESLPDLKRDAADAGMEYMIIPVNLLDTDAVGELVEKVIARFGRLDILINNIERGGMPIVHGEYVPDQWDMEMATTLRAKQWVFYGGAALSQVVGRRGCDQLLFHRSDGGP